jgi:enoyl-CoA hydratase
VLWVGREGKFSAGFDLSVMTSSADAMVALVAAGAELGTRLLTFPRPTVAACTGHALAMGGIMLLAFDHRVGADGPFKIGLNEVAIGMNVPDFAMELARFRIPQRYFAEVLFGTVHTPTAAVERGYLDEVVAGDSIDAAVARATEVATQLAQLDARAHSMSKDLARGPLAARIRERLTDDLSRFGRS